MKNKEIPFMDAIIHWCDNCQPEFNITKFAAEYNFDA
tara:strand:- start:13 stop:123 length:111 start_codon:yes stop_codon:yes gene_type:complete